MSRTTIVVDLREPDFMDTAVMNHVADRVDSMYDHSNTRAYVIAKSTDQYQLFCRLARSPIKGLRIPRRMLSGSEVDLAQNLAVGQIANSKLYNNNHLVIVGSPKTVPFCLYEREQHPRNSSGTFCWIGCLSHAVGCTVKTSKNGHQHVRLPQEKLSIFFEEL